MTRPPETAQTVADAAGELVADLDRKPAGRVSASVYETGRLVADAPWLGGHGRRLAYLLGEQGPDGAWGLPDGYGLVPTASAVEALVTVLVRDEPTDLTGPARSDVEAAAARGLRALARRLETGAPLPDTPAADLIVPALTDRIDTHLARLRDRDAPALPGALPLPRVDRRRLDAVSALLATDRPMPRKLWHAYEVLGPRAATRDEVRPIDGAVGASPAATARWLNHRRTPDRAARAYLDEVVARHDGPVPCCTPITVFERSWTLSTLLRAGVSVRPSPALVAGLAAALGPDGAATGPGLPADADTTSATLYALARLGRPVEPASLFRYDLGTHFCTWRGEDGNSITTNAHVLEALGWHARHTRDGASRYAVRVAALGGWLRDVQQPDGHWTDRWHASPYYATYCAALALAGHATPEVAGEAVDRAIGWVLATQRADGGWGRWSTTTEETAYAVHVLLGAGGPQRPDAAEAAHRALRHLQVSVADDPPLWHDKDLYTPVLVVRAAVLAARLLALGRGAARPGGEGADVSHQGMITSA
ncbi:prenyltransferase/squalene oxidase repeat-containing protein [Micromonospora craniellae]|uniref:prenyltransferase/squalene oxidase repeat-containing protein n=1 Tax=Micromonospora craniellae TaxID=2294034 RepID=UPI001CC53EBA|nr:prenyltransferase/squalene oxidase repeat-containing protein [Micromonospora craniellae]